jgi:hypothetical protein
MIWLFHRDEHTLQVETHFDNSTAEFVLAVRQADGTQQEERFKDVSLFGNRLDSLEKQVEAERWTATGAPIFLRDGWKI